MKPSRALLAFSLFLATLSAWAQPVPAPPPGPDPIAERLFPPELVMANQNALRLTAEQKNFFREEIRKTQLRFTELQWQLQDAMELLAMLLEPPRVEESQVLAQLEKVLDAERQIKQAQLLLMVRIKNQLTPEQQARLRELRPRQPQQPPQPPQPPGPPPPTELD